MKKSNLPYTLLFIAFFLSIAVIFCLNTRSTLSLGQEQISNSNTGIAVDINTATAEELTYLPGIGNDLAESIISYREQHGAFQSVEELMHIKGIGLNKYNEISKYLTVGGSK